MGDNTERIEKKEKKPASLLKSIKDMNAFIASSQFVAKQLGVISWSLRMQPQFESIRLLYGKIESIDPNTRQSLLVRGGLTKKIIEFFFPNRRQLFFREKKSLMGRIFSQANKFHNPKCMLNLHNTGGWVTSAVFNSSGTLLATGSDYDMTTKLWSFSPDGSKLTGMVSLVGNSSSVRCVAFHPMKPILATGSEEGDIKFWDTRNNTCLLTISTRISRYGPSYSVNSISFNQKSLILASGSEDGITRVWKLSSDVSSATCVATLVEHSRSVLSVAFHPTQSILATGSKDRTVKLWSFSPDVSTAACVATLEGHNDSVFSVAFHPTAPLLATGSGDNTTKLWNLSPDGSTATCVATLKGHSGNVMSVAFHLTEPILATGSDDETVKLWRLSPDGSTATCVSTLKGNSYSVPFVAFHPREPILATVSNADPSVVTLIK